MVQQAELVMLIDEALERFGGRDVVRSSEVIDLLLDLRLSLLDSDAFDQLLEGEHSPVR
jgi:hypothetical protein